MDSQFSVLSSKRIPVTYLRVGQHVVINAEYVPTCDCDAKEDRERPEALHGDGATMWTETRS